MEWYYLDNQEQQVGPLTEDALQNVISNGTIKKETMVWNESMESWLPAASSSLKSHFKTPPPPPTSTTPRNASPVPAVSAAVGFGRDDSLIYPTNPPRSPHSAWWSLIFPGVAQIVFGKTPMGITCIAVCFILSILTAGVTYIFILAAAIVDAYMTGNRLKEGTPVGKWQFFPRKKN
jgi:hypothetical protein